MPKRKDAGLGILGSLVESLMPESESGSGDEESAPSGMRGLTSLLQSSTTGSLFQQAGATGGLLEDAGASSSTRTQAQAQQNSRTDASAGTRGTSRAGATPPASSVRRDMQLD